MTAFFMRHVICYCLNHSVWRVSVALPDDSSDVCYSYCICTIREKSDVDDSQTTIVHSWEATEEPRRLKLNGEIFKRIFTTVIVLLHR